MIKAVSSSSSLIPSFRPVPSHRLTGLFGIVIAAGLALAVGAAIYFYRRKIQPATPTSFEIAKEHFAHGDYERALAHCQDAGIGDPREIALLKAKALFALRKNNDAMTICQQLVLKPLADQPLLYAEASLLLGNIWQREPNGLDYALQQYNTAWACLPPNDPNVPVRLRVEILIGKSLAIIKAKKETDYETASSNLQAAVGIAEENNRTQAQKDPALLAKAYYYWAYFFLITNQTYDPLAPCNNALDQLKKPRLNDQELNLKAEILLLQSLICEKKGDSDSAGICVRSVFRTPLEPRIGVSEIRASDKEIAAAAYFLRGRLARTPEDKINDFTQALQSIENDDALKALIQCERGHAYIQKALSSNHPESYQNARADFNISSENTNTYNPARSDLWQCILEMGEYKNLQERIQKGLAVLSR
jgi:hypothetical protein